MGFSCCPASPPNEVVQGVSVVQDPAAVFLVREFSGHRQLADARQRTPEVFRRPRERSAIGCWTRTAFRIAWRSSG